jgi:transcriptional regulator with XRE-family HTH domain
MIVGRRLRELREAKKLSQGAMEKRTGLLRCYISRVENGHTVPAIGTLERMARALEVPFYKLFYEGEVPPKGPNLPKRVTASEAAWDASGPDAQLLAKFRRHLTRMGEADRKLLISMARKMAVRRAGSTSIPRRQWPRRETRS